MGILFPTMATPHHHGWIQMSRHSPHDGTLWTCLICSIGSNLSWSLLFLSRPMAFPYFYANHPQATHIQQPPYSNKRIAGIQLPCSSLFLLVAHHPSNICLHAGTLIPATYARHFLTLKHEAIDIHFQLQIQEQLLSFRLDDGKAEKHLSKDLELCDHKITAQVLVTSSL